MKATTLGGLIGVAIIVACTIDRPSETLECNSDTDCDGFDELRLCTGGYCAKPDCPDDCTSCDEVAHTCLVECTSADDCDGEITCPSGWSCTVSCNGDGACDDVECESGATCAIACIGDGACGDIRCSSACQCDLDCVGGACDSMACPVIGNGANQVRCTTDGTTATECDSARDSRCDRC